MNFITQSMLRQYINEPARIRGEDRTTVLNLLFTRTKDEVTNIQYKTPLSNSDDVILQFNFLVQYDVESVMEKHREAWHNYKRINYKNLKDVYKEQQIGKSLEKYRI